MAGVNLVALYSVHPIDLQSTISVPRLNAQMLTLVAKAHPDWEVLAVSPNARPLPGVSALPITLPPGPRAALRVWSSRPGLRVLPGGQESFRKTQWARAAATRLAAERPDEPSTVIVCCHPEVVLAVRRAMTRARIVHWIHSVVAPGFEKMFLDAGKATDAAVVCSPGVYRSSWNRLHERFVPPVWIIPNWVDDAFYRPLSPAARGTARAALGLTDRDIAIAFVGRDWIKGGHVIEQALVAIDAPEVQRIVLLSAGERRAGRETLGPQREVWKLGVLRQAELHKMYAAADIGVVPSVVHEAMPLVPIEMMATGLPVIASRSGGLPDFIEDEVDGLLVDMPNSVEEWAEKLGRVLAETKLRARLGNAARTAVAEGMSPDRACERWSRMLGVVSAG